MQSPPPHSPHPPSWWAQFQEVSGAVRRGPGDRGPGRRDHPEDRLAAAAPGGGDRHRGRRPSPQQGVQPGARRARREGHGPADRDGRPAERPRHRRGHHHDGGRRALPCAAGPVRRGRVEAEPFLGTVPLLRVFVAALRLERFDVGLTVRLIRAGQRPAAAVQTGLAVGKYGWWPDWLIKIVSERAMAGALDEETITALDRCAYAELSPAQARIARRLLSGDQAMIDASAAPPRGPRRGRRRRQAPQGRPHGGRARRASDSSLTGRQTAASAADVRR